MELDEDRGDDELAHTDQDQRRADTSTYDCKDKPNPVCRSAAKEAEEEDAARCSVFVAVLVCGTGTADLL